MKQSIQPNHIDLKFFDELCDAMLLLKDKAECRKFLLDLCTEKELTEMSERLQVARKVRNKESYRSIANDLGSSTTTVTRVAHWYHHGMGGYRQVLGRLEKK